MLVADRGDADSLFIAGVVEIKSFPATFARIRPQLEAHVDRLQHGLRIGDSSWLPDRLFAVRWVKRKGWLDGIEPADWKRVLRILVSPCRRGSGRAETIRPPCHKLTLPVSHATLAAAAYELTVRFLESIGTKLFADERPWPEMTPEEAATNAMQEALYHILLEERAGRPHALWVAKRLYNVYGFGLDAADKHRKMMWSSGDGDPTDRPEDPPDAEPPASSCVKALLHGAWHHFRSGDFQHAESWVQAALQEDAEEAETRRAPWLLGMTHFYQAEFAHACEVLPDPGPRPTPDDGSWPKDMLTLTRARARCGQLERAQEIVDVLVQEDLRWDYLSVALPTVKGWVAHGRGDTDSVDALLAEACENIEGLRDEQRVRTETGQGSPPYHDPGAIQAAVVDTAMLLAVRGRHDEAFQLLKPVEALFPPVLGLLASDPVFDPVRRGAGFKRWLLDRRRE